jgi:hypothetical protein
MQYSNQFSFHLSRIPYLVDPNHPSLRMPIFGSRILSYLLDVVVGKSASILQLLTSEDQSLLVRWDSLLVLDLGLDIVDGIGGLDLKGDGLAREGLDEAVRI